MKIIAITVVILIGSLSGYFYWATKGASMQPSCSALISMVGDEENRSILTSWVQKNVKNSINIQSYIVPSGGNTLGHYSLNIPFDWGAIGIKENEKWHIGLLAPYKSDGSLDADNIKSVSFSFNSRRAVLVSVLSNNDYGVGEFGNKYLNELHSNVAIYCEGS